MALWSSHVVVNGHLVNLKIDSKGVVLFVNGRTAKMEGESPEIRVKIALAARRLWREALPNLPKGAYLCMPICPDRRRLYISAGWQPFPTGGNALVYYHGVPPLPPGWMDWEPPEDFNEDFSQQ